MNECMHGLDNFLGEMALLERRLREGKRQEMSSSTSKMNVKWHREDALEVDGTTSSLSAKELRNVLKSIIYNEGFKAIYTGPNHW